MVFSEGMGRIGFALNGQRALAVAGWWKLGDMMSSNTVIVDCLRVRDAM